MSKTLLITDTSSDIPLELVEYNDVEIIPIIFTINGKPYSENIDFINDNFYEIIPNRDCISSFQIPAAVYLDRFTKADSHGYTDVLVITSDSKISPMYNSANEAKEMFKNNKPHSTLNIHIIDTMTYTMGTGLVVLKAAKLISNETDIKEILSETNEIVNRVKLIVNSFSIKCSRTDDPFEWVKKMAAEITHPFPTLSIVQTDAQELPIKKGDHTAFDQFYAYCVEALTDKKPPYAVGYAVREKEAQSISMLLEQELGYPPITTYKIGALSAYCSGRASITLTFLGDKITENVE